VETPELIEVATVLCSEASVAEAASEFGPYGIIAGFATGVGTYAAVQYFNGAISNFLANDLGMCTGQRTRTGD
jgi:hypothetical protein